jgi:hypothetical protein
MDRRQQRLGEEWDGFGGGFRIIGSGRGGCGGFGGTMGFGKQTRKDGSIKLPSNKRDLVTMASAIWDWIAVDALLGSELEYVLGLPSVMLACSLSISGG